MGRTFALGLVCLLAAAVMLPSAGGQDKDAATQPSTASAPSSLATPSPAPSAPSIFEYMCPKCKEKLDIVAEAGKCAECGGPTISRSFKLCTKCAAKLQQCEQCRAPLTPGPSPSPSPSASASPSPSPTPATSPAETPKPAPKKVGVFDHGRTISVPRDQGILVELAGPKALPWEVTKVDGQGLQQVGGVEFKPKSEGAADGTYSATFKAVKEGKTVIRLQALIEAGKKEKKEFTCTVIVTAGGT